MSSYVFLLKVWSYQEQPVDVDNGGVAYDYGSIMHYRSKAFAKFDDLFTLSTFVRYDKNFTNK